MRGKNYIVNYICTVRHTTRQYYCKSEPCKSFWWIYIRTYGVVDYEWNGWESLVFAKGLKCSTMKKLEIPLFHLIFRLIFLFNFFLFLNLIYLNFDLYVIVGEYLTFSSKFLKWGEELKFVHMSTFFRWIKDVFLF